MFRGIHALTLDAKGRLAIPSKHRDALAAQCLGRLVCTINPDSRCLWLYPLPAWEEIEHVLDGLPSLDQTVRRMQRLLIGHATECDLDAQGRLLLPPPLREFAALDKHAVLIGQGKKFEIWDETEWNERREGWLKADAGDYRQLSDELKKLSL